MFFFSRQHSRSCNLWCCSQPKWETKYCFVTLYMANRSTTRTKTDSTDWTVFFRTEFDWKRRKIYTVRSLAAYIFVHFPLHAAPEIHIEIECHRHLPINDVAPAVIWHNVHCVDSRWDIVDDMTQMGQLDASWYLVNTLWTEENGRHLETTFRPFGITAVLMSLFVFGPLKCRRMKVVQWDIYPRWTTNRALFHRVICDTVVPVKVEYPRFKIGCKALSKRFKAPKIFEGLIYMIVLGRNGLMCQAVSAV